MPRRTQRQSQRSRLPKVLAWSAVVLAVLVFAGVVGLKAWVNSYLRSPKFRSQIAARMAEHMQAQVEVAPISFDTTQFYCDGLKGEGAREGKFSDISVENVRGEFRLPSVWRMLFGDKKFRVESVDVQRVKVDFFDRRLDLDIPRPEKGGKVTEIGRINVRELALAWDGGAVSGLKVTARPVDGGWQVENDGDGGRAAQKGFPAADIVSLRLVHKEPSLFLQDSKLRCEGGEVTATGEVREKEKLDLQFKVRGVNVTQFLPDDWRARLHGRMTGNGRVQYSLRDGPAASPLFTGHLELEDAVLEALPVLAKIAEFTKTDRFRHLALNQVRGDFVHAKDGLRVTNFVFESERLIKVTGAFVVANGEIDGSFDVGVTPGPLQWLPGSQDKVFNVNREGYAWTKMRVVGPVHSPREDLSQRLYAAAQNAVVEKVENTATQAVGTAVDTAKKGATGVLDLLFGN